VIKVMPNSAVKTEIICGAASLSLRNILAKIRTKIGIVERRIPASDEVDKETPTFSKMKYMTG